MFLILQDAEPMADEVIENVFSRFCPQWQIAIKACLAGKIAMSQVGAMMFQ
jgi:hypothetical protein